MAFVREATNFRDVALSSTSTVDDARAQYRNSGGWRRDGSVALAHDRLEAIEFLKDAEPNGSADGISWSSPDRKAEEDEVRAFIAARDTSASAGGPRATRLRPSPRFRG
jgi:hypothetical protein